MNLAFPFQQLRPVLVGLLFAVAILPLAGCGKSDAAKVNQATPAESANPTAVNQPPAGEPDLAEVNRNVMRWILKNKRPPKNFEDFAATADVTIPPAPAGKKYVLSKDMHVKLVNQ